MRDRRGQYPKRCRTSVDDAMERAGDRCHVAFERALAHGVRRSSAYRDDKRWRIPGLRCGNAVGTPYQLCAA